MTEYAWGDEAVEDVEENAEQVKSWNKYGKESYATFWTVLLVGFFLGVVVSVICLTPLVIIN